MTKRFKASEAVRLLQDDNNETDVDSDSESQSENESNDSSNFHMEAEDSDGDGDDDDNIPDTFVQSVQSQPSTSTTATAPDHHWASATNYVSQPPQFSGLRQVLVPTDGFSPADYWKLFLNDDLIAHTVYQTNLYAEQKLHST